MAETEGGSGGKKRSAKINELVREMASDGTPSDPAYVAPKKKAPYVPSEKERKTRQYGAPISPPITRMYRGQHSDHMNKYS